MSISPTPYRKPKEDLVKERLQSILDNMQDAYFQLDLSGKLTFLNSAALTLYGYSSKEEMLGKSALNFYENENDREQLLINLRNNQKTSDLTAKGKRKDGSTFWASINAKYIYDEQGSISGTEGLVRDITERIEAEKEKAKLLSRFKLISEHIPGMIFQYEISPDGSLSIPYSSPGVKHIFGVTPEEINGNLSFLLEKLHPDDFDRIYKNFIDSRTKRREWRDIFRTILPSGKTIWVEGRATPSKSQDGTVIWHGYLQDITENKKIEENLYKSNRLYAVISQVNQATVHIKDREMLFQEICNISIDYGKFVMAWIGLIDKSTKQVVPFVFAGQESGYLSSIPSISVDDIPEGRGIIGTSIREDKCSVIANCQSDPTMAPWKDEMNKRGYNSCIAFPIKESGEIIGAFTLYAHDPNFFDQSQVKLLTEVAADINFALDTLELERKHKQSIINLAISEQRFRNMFEHMPSGYILFELIYDGNGAPIDYRLIEANDEFDKQTGLKRQELIGLTSAEFPWSWPPNLTNDFYNVAITGKPISFERYEGILNRYYDIRISSPRKDQLAMLFYDITDRKKTEEAVLESNETLQSIIESTTDAIWTVDPVNFEILTYNQSLYNIILKENGVKVHVGDVPIVIGPSNPKKWITYYKKALKLGKYDFEYGFFSESKTFHISLSTLKRGNVIFGISAFAKDITEQKNREDEIVKAKEKAEESNKFKSSFLANMSHEIRTPLNSILGFSDLLLDSSAEPKQQLEFINYIKQNGDNLLAIISDVLDISKIEAGQINIQPKRFWAGELIKKITRNQIVTLKEKDFTIRTNLPKNDLQVYGDEARVEQIIINFLSNAIKFTEVGFIDIGYYITSDSVQFYVKDTGIGIPPEYHKTIFERFGQADNPLKRRYGGTGLGLSISSELAKLMGGRLSVESEVGKGSTFYFFLPYSSEIIVSPIA